MGLYNRVRYKTICKGCSASVDLHVQFKYGETWLHEYELGELVLSGEPGVGQPGRRQVVIDGAAEPCPNCGFEHGDYEVWLKNDIISDIRPASGVYRFDKETFIVIED